MTGSELKDLRMEQGLTMDGAARRISQKLGRRVVLTDIAGWEAGAMVIPKDLTADCLEPTE